MGDVDGPTSQANWSDQPVDRAGITSLVQPMSPQTAANQDIDISSRLLRTRYRTGQPIHGSGWFYSGYSGFHPPFLKRFSELIKRDKKRKELKRLKILKLTTENKTFFKISPKKKKKKKKKKK